MRSFLFLLTTAALAGALTACTLRPPESSEELMVDSMTLTPELAQGITAKPFCLHLRYSNEFYVAYSDSRTEAWITEGRCDSAKADKRRVDGIRLSWWNDWYDTQTNRQCLDTDACRMNDQNVVEGRNIRCASAQARDGNQTAFITTDHAVCH
ncbi:MAG: hypothetical protein EPO09_20075 [Aquabacterium sp.]|uniref:hypothetical protein n=1 Tax=Aquabacterium sp. TaxID=1872578 RepID=UPI0011F59C1C|nr:hypothetical protein [Aquabacterium sp.]TAK85761.1 MAG: hypothetical protein EPO09_20075 [Aquabacterium sp.]